MSNPALPDVSLNRVSGANGNPVLFQAPLAFQNPAHLAALLAPMSDAITALLAQVENVNIDGGSPDSIPLPLEVDGGTP